MSDGGKIIEGLREAVAYARGQNPDVRLHRVYVPDAVDVRAIRDRLGLSQEEFAERFGFKVATIRNWEQKRRTPDGSARLFLKVIDRDPEAVERALAS